MAHPAGQVTRARLLEAAAEVFAEQGYRHAKIRDICTKANANVASVNYHFRDKEQLYMAVIEYVLQQAQPQAPHLSLNPGDPPEEQLRSFIHAFVTSLLTPNYPEMHARLVAHETIDPTPALDMVVEKLVRPLSDALDRIVGQLLGAAAVPDLVELCSVSIISQCTLYHNSREILKRLNPQRKYDSTAVAQLSEHITRFSLAGLAAYMGGAPKPKTANRSTR